MPDYQWAIGKGKIITSDYDRTKTLNAEHVKIEIEKSFSNLFEDVSVLPISDELKEVYEVTFSKEGILNTIYVCAKGTTPGGRSNLQNEQRIQQKAKYLNFAYNKRLEGKKAICLGIYKHDSDTVFCAWNINKSTAAPETPISKQIKVSTIARALTEGFVQQMSGSGEYVCAFRSDFIYFYIANSDWIHKDTVLQLNNNNNNVVEKVDDTLIESDSKNKNELLFNTSISAEKARNRILFGAPGTGKSYTLNNDLEQLLGENNEDDYERVTFHLDYSYANFVGTYKPVMVEDSFENLTEIAEKDVVSVLTDKSKSAQEKYDLLYDKFKDDGLTRLPLLLGLYTDENFTTRKADGSAAVGDNSVERNHGKAIRPYVNLSKPTSRKKDISYEYVPGPFMRILVKSLKNAMTDNPRPFVLLIEEINRANVAAVFGDVFQLLDRDSDGVSEYKIATTYDMRKYLAQELEVDESQVENIKIPNNMFIWATMNSADQGVFPMDTAFKRRWDFTYLGIDDNDEKIRGKYVYLANDKSQKVEWNKLRKAINNFLANSKINEDKQLGPYFISKNIITPKQGDEIDRERFVSAFKNKVIMYLYEDAAKQKRSKLFEGCSQNSTRYSQICKEFDQKGVKIFNQDIISECEIEDVEAENDNSDN